LLGFCFLLHVSDYLSFPSFAAAPHLKACFSSPIVRNIFDLIVVIVSLVSVGIDNVPGLSVLRLMRAFRVLRLFARLASLRQVRTLAEPQDRVVSKLHIAQ
jgi:hypothetical protein